MEVEEEVEDGGPMQANPSYRPLEMSNNSQEHTYVNINYKLAPPDLVVLQANPSYQPVEYN